MHSFVHTLFVGMLSLPSIFSLNQSLEPTKEDPPVRVHAVTDLSHEFSFYADGRFHRQYLQGQRGVTNWCSLPNQDLTNANLLVLLASDDRLRYTPQDKQVIKKFLDSGAGVVIFGSGNAAAQNDLLASFGAGFTSPAQYPLQQTSKSGEMQGQGASVLDLERADQWKVLVQDSKNNPVVAQRKVGKGTLLVSARELAGSHPSARDSINQEFWRPLLVEIASGKNIDPSISFKGCGISDLENKEEHPGFVLSYSDYLAPYADAMVDVYKRSFPHIEKRMGVPLSPGMASHITLLATGGGGFSSGNTIGLAVWWGGFPEREDSMIEFLTHESVHSWVLPFPEVWNEAIATYVGNLVMMDMGYQEEAEKRIERTINRARSIDPTMKLYDLQGNSTGDGKELSGSQKNDIHWGKSFWILEELRKENPEVIADYFRYKRQLAKPENLDSYGMNETVALLSRAMNRDLFGWFNAHGIPVSPDKTPIKVK